MATNTPVPVAADSPIAVKITYHGSTKKFKIPLGELTPALLPAKLRSLLNIPEGQSVAFERFSDSAGAYISLDPSNAPAYRTLFRAAKAKQKLRLRASTMDNGIRLPTEGFADSLANRQAAKQAAADLTRRLSKMRLDPAFSASETTLNNNNNTSGGVVRNTAASGNVAVPVSILDAEGEAPIPRPFAARELTIPVSRARELGFPGPYPLQVPGCTWSVYCNSCDTALPDEHWHCNVCDQGDYDLCQSCLDDGKHCKNEIHWMIKRSVKSGQVVTSTTERVPPKVQSIPVAPPPEPTFTDKFMPGAFTEEQKPEPTPVPDVLAAPTRTCNSCVKVFPEAKFVTCQACDDYDLCMDCHCNNKHGHHPAHAFKAAVPGTAVRPLVDFLLGPGRNVRHAALCDNCDKHIYGIRHKCLNCPDWDYCSECFKNASRTHHGHRFVPVYEPLADARSNTARHVGIYCDGPLCGQSGAANYITGVRYKCAICHDLDFCANCEASPRNRHNRTHPLIKLKTPVRNVSVSTTGEDANGDPMRTMGDQTSCTRPCNTVSEVQPIVDVKPAEESTPKPVERIEIKDLLAEPIMEKIKVQNLLSPVAPISSHSKKPVNAPTTELNAHFVRDTVTDGTKMLPNQRFVQSWILKNPGPHAWPAGCCVRYVGGDNMLAVSDITSREFNEAATSSIIDRAVQVGEEATCRVFLKAPTREGTSISYWRLKSPDGMPFGHRLWCHIDVSNSVDNLSTITGHDENREQEWNSDTAMLGLVALMDKRRQAMSEAVKDTQRRVEALLEKQKTSQASIDDNSREKRIQMLRALHAARLAAVSAEKQDFAANMQPASEQKMEGAQDRQNPSTTTRAPPAPTVEDVSEKEESAVAKTEQVVRQSTMIFPKLDKESPASSMHDGSSTAATATTATEPATSAPATEMPLSPGSERPSLFEDAESVDIMDDSDSDSSGFFTDEEYDILVASDSEFNV